MTYLLYTLPVLMAILNRIRGGALLPFKGINAYVVAIAVGGLILLITNNVMAAGICLGLYILGESFGWGKWLAAIPHWNSSGAQARYNDGGYGNLIKRDDGKNIGIHFIANKIANEKENFALYGKIALFLRGIFWWTPFYIALVSLGLVNLFFAGLAVLGLGITMPLSYMLTYKIFGEKKYWPYGEVVYGAFQGLALMLVFL